MNNILSHWHEYVYIILAVLFVSLYILHFLPGKVSPVIKTMLEVETVLMVVLIFVAVIAVRVESISATSDERAEALATLLNKVENREGLGRIQKFDSLTAYISGLRTAIQHTDREVMRTVVWNESRDSASQFLPSADEWFTELDLWSSQPDHTVYQIIGAADGDQKQWFETECQNKNSFSGRVSRFLHGESERPFINMVIFDDREFFLAFRKPQEHINQAKLYHIQSEDMTDLMKQYFMTLFDKSDKCPSSPTQP